jgi:hypothetical protein
MKVRVIPSDMGGCGWYRLRWVAAALADQGADVEIAESVAAYYAPTRDGEVLVDVPPFEADVAVFQRVFTPDHLQIMQLLHKQGVAIVVDVDDDFYAMSPHHVTYASLHPATGGDSWAVLRETVKLADVVTVSTPALARKYNGVVIENCVPRAYLDIPPGAREGPPVIGWTGTPWLHPGDLEVVGTAVADVCSTGTPPIAAFRAIGAPATLDVLGVPDQQHQPGLDLASFNYARAVANLDVGIVPLCDSAFNEAKSWLKGLEYAALGVPFVASPVAEYVRLLELGAGITAVRPREWRSRLRWLAELSEDRANLADIGRRIAANLTIEGTMAPQAWDAWQAAARINSRRGDRWLTAPL